MTSGGDSGHRDGERRDLARKMRTALSVIDGRAQLMRRRQDRGGEDALPTEADYAGIAAAGARLRALIDRLDP